MKFKKTTSFMISLFIFLTFTIFPTNVFAEEIETSSFNFDAKTGTITGYNGKGGEVTIPEQIDGVEVTTIGKKAFFQNKNITSVSMPNVTEIGSYAFKDCTNLTSATMPKVTKINSSAFSHCENLSSVTMPNVNKIDHHAFEYCEALQTLNMPNVTKIEEYTFHECSSLTSVEMPKVNEIGSGVFFNCSNLTSVTMPNVTKIDSGVFLNCSNLASVTIPKVNEIGSSAFYRCSSLNEVTFGETAPTIGDNAFDGIKIGAKAIVPYGCIGKDEGLYNNNAYPFIDDSPLQLTQAPPSSPFEFDAETGTITKYIGTDKEVTIPEQIDGVDVTKIDSCAFSNNENITSINTSNVTCITGDGFKNCTNLTSAIMPKVTNIYNNVFENCTKLTSVNMPKVTKINDYAFSNCSSLSSVNLSNINILGSSTFYNCSSLNEVTIKSNPDNIGCNVFDGCENLKSATMPNITKISRNFFKDCENLSSVTMPNATEIGSSAFIHCKVLQKLEIPKVTKINNFAFYDCSSLNEVTFGETAPTIGNNAFDGIKEGARAIVPYGCIGEEEGQYNNSTYPFIDNSPLQLTQAPKPTPEPTPTPKPTPPSSSTTTSSPDPTPTISNVNKIDNKNNTNETSDTVEATIEGVGDTTFDPNTILVVDVVTTKLPVNKKDIVNKGIKVIAKDKELKELFDIKLLLDGVPIQPNGTVNVKIKLTKEQQKIKGLQIIYIDDEGNSEAIPYNNGGEYVSFTTTHFSNYAIIGEVTKTVTPLPKTGVNTPILPVVIIFICSSIILTFVSIKNNKSKEK